MKGINELVLGIKSGYSFFYLESQEINRTVEDIKVCINGGKERQIVVWDHESSDPSTGESKFNDPDEALLLLENMSGGSDNVPPNTVVIAKNYNWFLVDEYGNCNKSRTSWLLNRSAKFSRPEARKILIIVGNAPFDKAIPDVLKRDFAHIELELPDEKEIEQV